MDDKPAVRGKPDAVLRECEHLTSIVRRRTPIPKSSGMHFKSTGDTPGIIRQRNNPPDLCKLPINRLTCLLGSRARIEPCAKVHVFHSVNPAPMPSTSDEFLTKIDFRYLHRVSSFFEGHLVRSPQLPPTSSPPRL